MCDALFWHGPGHQSRTRCDVEGDHEIHHCVYGSYEQEAEWRDGDYTGAMRAQGIKFDPESYPENIGMSGYFNEPPAPAKTGAEPSSPVTHGMIPGSHERSRGPECRCGRSWPCMAAVTGEHTDG